MKTCHEFPELLAGVGPKTEESLQRLGVYTIGDLLFHLPSNVHDRSRRIPLTSAQEGETITLEVSVENFYDTSHPSAPKKVLCKDVLSGESVSLTYFLGKAAYAQAQWMKIKSNLEFGLNTLKEETLLNAFKFC